MKYIYLIILPLFFWACEDFEEVNTSPNNPEKVSSNFVLTYVLSESAKLYESLGRYGNDISGAMQYTQRGTQFNNTGPNYYGWSSAYWGGYYDILRNNQIIYDNSVAESHPFFQGVSLVMKSFLFGTLTDLYGDIPYSESLSANDEIFFPKYDDQKEVYVGVLKDLKMAAELLANVDVSKDAISATSDIYFHGNPEKWRRFANALRMRYAMRLYNKKGALSEVDIANEFKAASTYTMADNSDNAVLDYVGANSSNAAPGGPINSSNPNFAIKPGSPFVNLLVETNDPRLDRWVLPVQRKWDSSVDAPTVQTVTNIYGETYDVTYMPVSSDDLNTDLYVGLPIGLSTLDAISYNIGDDSDQYNPEQNPHISFLHSRYRLNSEDLVKMKLMTYSEVNFLMAEAVLKGDMGLTGDAETFYKEGIRASMQEWAVFTDAVDFDFDQYYSNAAIDYSENNNQLEKIMTQKWIGSWLRPEAWFDWRRTGLPALVPGEITQFGDALPIRYIYPSPNLDPSYLVNYEAAVNKLESTEYVPVGQSKDHNYSRMWLLQGTGSPW